MNFLLDESLDARIAGRLRQDGHQVACVWEMSAGIDDEIVLADSTASGAILVTADKDFGELVFLRGQAASGVLFVRLAELSPDAAADLVAAVVGERGAELIGAFTVIQPGKVRIRRVP